MRAVHTGLFCNWETTPGVEPTFKVSENVCVTAFQRCDPLQPSPAAVVGTYKEQEKALQQLKRCDQKISDVVYVWCAGSFEKMTKLFTIPGSRLGQKRLYLPSARNIWEYM